MPEQNKNFDYTYYGTKCTAAEVRQFIDHLLHSNREAGQQGRKRIPVCIWGRHGIGKTELVEQYAKANGYAFNYIAPAQFEEMGDLLGMPQIVDNKTIFVAPEWVPQSKGPGILLIDDVNRADDRILRGIMQLLQKYELVSWKLPPDWHIILTANPDGGDYSVTPLDDAMITRMMHITMTFDVKSWAKWANQAGVDERGIAFVLLYPEIVNGERTTPRTLVQFFESISKIKDLNDNLALVQMLADACLDTTAATSFISFVQNNLSELIWPEEIITTTDFQLEIEQRLRNLVLKNPQAPRIDLLATICNRLIHHITLDNTVLDSAGIRHIQQFILLDFLPNDIRLGMLQDMVSSPHSSLKQIISHPEIGKILLAGM